jgi:uncharacterized protein (TIRG00374 family)
VTSLAGSASMAPTEGRSDSSTSRRGLLVWLGAALVSAALVGSLVALAGPARLVAVLRIVDPLTLLVAATALAAANLPHAVRLHVLLGAARRSGFGRLMVLTLRYGLYVAVLPARLGEIAYMARLRRDLRLPTSIAVAVTVQQRLLDLVVIGGLALVAGLGLASTLVDGRVLVLVGGSVVAAAVVVTSRLPRTLAVLARVVLAVSSVRWRWRNRVLIGLLRARRWARGLGRPRAFVGLLCLTSLEWALNIAGIVLIVAAAGVALPSRTLAEVACVVLVAGAVPLHTIGGIGLVEAGLAGALRLVGVSTADAVGVAVVARAVLLAVPVVLWAPAAAAVRSGRRRLAT